ncbi:uncharacterized protein K452DRAFT_74924 [Aplosporella prunicola CBS 121167]|uniref:Uncharacterized protein n=1 Tax=Aplosporella prunicola CBS 121167 TaxID=1176127 RepID=A0A6A6B5Z9_9PEZI|nr:uncharacterized protein K452DRAFT_74924 [Aplosporella prunicola CBS 121167]KAF2139296.1 hypothetical protein K452DRAFT_74924 [Aplosporella prunicola CBS 121167]
MTMITTMTRRTSESKRMINRSERARGYDECLLLLPHLSYVLLCLFFFFIQLPKDVYCPGSTTLLSGTNSGMGSQISFVTTLSCRSRMDVMLSEAVLLPASVTGPGAASAGQRLAALACRSSGSNIYLEASNSWFMKELAPFPPRDRLVRISSVGSTGGIKVL